MAATGDKAMESSLGKVAYMMSCLKIRYSNRWKLESGN